MGIQEDTDMVMDIVTVMVTAMAITRRMGMGRRRHET
jgi:hypothetical protein